LFVGIATVAFVYANFRAFDDLNTKQIDARNSPGESAYRWSALSPAELAALRSALKNTSYRDLAKVACSDNDCRDLTGSFVRLFHELGWSTVADIGPHLDVPVGIELWQRNDSDHRLADIIEAATNRRLKIVIKKWDYSDAMSIGMKP
jgi:hypothetical protein